MSVLVAGSSFVGLAGIFLRVCSEDTEKARTGGTSTSYERLSLSLRNGNEVELVETMRLRQKYPNDFSSRDVRAI